MHQTKTNLCRIQAISGDTQRGFALIEAARCQTSIVIRVSRKMEVVSSLLEKKGDWRENDAYLSMSFRDYIRKFASQTRDGRFFCRLCNVWVNKQRWPHFKVQHRYSAKAQRNCHLDKFLGGEKL
jgi:hypothetical protein